MGRLTRDPEVRYSQGENSTAIARYTLAVDRRFRRNNDGEQTADFIGCVAFGRSAEFAEKYFRQGLKVIVTGRIQTGSYTNKEGQKVYTTDVVVEDQEFAESKAVSDANAGSFRAAAPSPARNRGRIRCLQTSGGVFRRPPNIRSWKSESGIRAGAKRPARFRWCGKRCRNRLSNEKSRGRAH